MEIYMNTYFYEVLNMCYMCVQPVYTMFLYGCIHPSRFESDEDLCCAEGWL